jgi:hypothetical protein
MQKMFKPFWFYFTALLMTKDLSDVLFSEFKKKLPVSEYAESQTKNEKRGYSKNRMVVSYFRITLTSPKWMTKVKNLKTEEWPSGRAYMIADELKREFRPKICYRQLSKG